MKKNNIEKFSPSTNIKLYDVDIMSPEEVNGICSNAKIAFENWKKTSLEDRKAYLRSLINVIHNNSDRIIQTIIMDVEKPLCEAETEIIEGCDILEYYCSESFDGIDSPIEIVINKDVWPKKSLRAISTKWRLCSYKTVELSF